MNGWEATLSEDEKNYLGRPFEKTDHQISGRNTPGPDGLNACFYQTHWQIVREEVIHTVLDILNNKGDPTALNQTVITDNVIVVFETMHYIKHKKSRGMRLREGEDGERPIKGVK
ncbi:hypothetical protein AKJ16_DCAP05368 [Drosera capensis]